jgi:hypothetical protein
VRVQHQDRSLFHSVGTFRQKSHIVVLIVGSIFWQNWHISPFSRIILQVWQKSPKNSVLFEFPSSSSFIMSVINGLISRILPTSSKCPLTCLVYLLTADWEMPKISATRSCLNPYVCTSSVANVAFIAGTTDLTAISQGSIK